MKFFVLCDKCKENSIEVSPEDDDFFKANEDVVVWCKECCEGSGIDCLETSGKHTQQG